MENSLQEKKIKHIQYPENVLTVTSPTSLKDVLVKMKEKRVGSIIVQDGETISGIFTERDLLLKISTEESQFLERPISDFMTPNPKCVNADDPIKRAMMLMRVGRFRHIVVTDSNQRLKGILSVKDLVDFLLDEEIFGS